MKKNQTPATRAGALWGTVDGSTGKMLGARARWMQQPLLTEADWPAFRAAYDAAEAQAARDMRGAR